MSKVAKASVICVAWLGVYLILFEHSIPFQSLTTIPLALWRAKVVVGNISSPSVVRG